MKQFIIINTCKYATIASLIYFAMTKYEQLHNPLNQSLWVYMLVYFPAVVGFVNLLSIAGNYIVNKLKSWK